MANLLAGFESFKSVMDGEEETPDINIEIEIDAGAAEAEAEMDEMEQPMEAASAMSEAAEEGEQAAELTAIMTKVLHKHGLTPSLHMVIKELGMDAVTGTRLASLEKLDPHGRNDAYAKTLIASFEAADASYWERTKAFMKRIWDYIKEAFHKAVSFFQNYQKAVYKAMMSLKDLGTLDVKDIKYKVTKEDLCNNETVTDLTTIVNGLSDLPDLDKKNPFSKMKKNVEGIGLKVKDEKTEKDKDGNEVYTFKTEQNKEFFATDEKELNEGLLGECQKGGVRAAAAVDLATLVVDGKNTIDQLTGNAIRSLDSAFRSTKFSGGSEDDVNASKKKITEAKERATSAQKVVAQIIKVAKAGCADYLRMCAALRKAATHAKVA